MRREEHGRGRSGLCQLWVGVALGMTGAQGRISVVDVKTIRAQDSGPETRSALRSCDSPVQPCGMTLLHVL